MDIIKLPQNVEKIIGRLEAKGYKAYIVGGCVRDSLLGRLPGDWDICTDALPCQMKEVFNGLQVVETGIKHGTLSVVIDKEVYEVTTFRIDGEYLDNRRPSQVTFTDKLERDLSRRDFTVNAMAYSNSAGVIDPFCGTEDLRNKRIICVGDADTRFKEDALRIMRGVRFAAQLEFFISEDTAMAMIKNKDLLRNISVERLRDEFTKTVCGIGAERACMEYKDVIAEIIPEVRPMFDLDQKNKYHRYDVWEHTLKVVSEVRDVKALKLAAFFHDVGKPGCMFTDERGIGHFYGHEFLGADITADIMKALKYDKKTADTVTELVRYHNTIFKPGTKMAKRLLNKLGADFLFLLIELESADVRGQSEMAVEERLEKIKAFKGEVEKIICQEQCFSLKDMDINGRDLMDAGMKRGKILGTVLSELLEKVMDGETENKKETLLEEAKVIYSRETGKELDS